VSDTYTKDLANPFFFRILNNMETNLEKYKQDLEKLIDEGERLLGSLYLSERPNSVEVSIDELEIDPSELEKLPFFHDNYQIWYSESLTLLEQLLPNRVSDFTKFYQYTGEREKVTSENYTIEDVLAGYCNRPIFSKFRQQLAIIKSVTKRFESSLFDIKQLVQADLFDSELDKAQELNKKGFIRAAGAVAGVVLEKHLKQICEKHNIQITKNNPTINDLNQLLKNNNVIETDKLHLIQHLGDLRNLCDHSKEREPTKEDVEELIEGVRKIIKTIF